MSLPFSVLSLSLWEHNTQSFVKKLGHNFQSSGFCGLIDHTIEEKLIDEVIEISRKFFSLPDNVKMKYFEPGLGGARGYTPIKIETPKGGYDADIKEFWQTGRVLSRGHRLEKWMPPNKWAEEIPYFKEKMSELFSQFDKLGKTLLQAVALFLDLEKNYFEEIVSEGNNVMRSIHYPPIKQDELGERSGAHEDINLITLLVGGHQPGLQIYSKKKGWESADQKRGIIICNIGDMLQRFTNHKLVSTTHRVVNPFGKLRTKSRFSIPYFVHPNPDWFLETLDSCCTEDNPKRYEEGILSEDYLQERLKEIKLIK